MAEHFDLPLYNLVEKFDFPLYYTAVSYNLML
jgi:hypothetical protein